MRVVVDGARRVPDLTEVLPEGGYRRRPAARMEAKAPARHVRFWHGRALVMVNTSVAATRPPRRGDAAGGARWLFRCYGRPDVASDPRLTVTKAAAESESVYSSRSSAALSFFPTDDAWSFRAAFGIDCIEATGSIAAISVCPSPAS